MNASIEFDVISKISSGQVLIGKKMERTGIKSIYNHMNILVLANFSLILDKGSHPARELR